MIEVEFLFYSKDAKVLHIPATFTRSVSALPRVGDHIVHHADGASPIFLVREVTHSFEDRPDYQGKPYGGDRVHVTMEPISREQSAAVFNELVSKAKAR